MPEQSAYKPVILPINKQVVRLPDGIDGYSPLMPEKFKAVQTHNVVPLIVAQGNRNREINTTAKPISAAKEIPAIKKNPLLSALIRK
jgi:hypothetical protein